MNGDELCKKVILLIYQITELIAKNFVPCILIGHSSDDGKKVIEQFT